MSPRLSELLLSSQSDERLVSLARAGHERAFAAIVERYRPELQATARRLCRDGHSEDVVQQAFLSAFTALRSGAEVTHLRGWLYQILRNAAGRPQAPSCLPLDRATATSDTLEDIVQQRALAMSALSEIGRLPARQRQAMVGTALDGRPRAEIASSMGLSEGAVRQLVHRARATLRGAVTALTPWPLARWIAAVGPDAPGPGELAAGAGAVSSGGLVLKLGALLASGTFLTGAAVHLQQRPSHSGAARTAPPATRVASPSRSASVSLTRHAAHHGRHEETSMGSGSGSGRRSEGSQVDDHGGRGERTDGGGSSPVSSGSDGHGRDAGQRGGSRTDGGDGSGTRVPTATGSEDGSATSVQMLSDSHPLDESDTRDDFGSGSDGRSGSGSGSGSGSDGGSATGNGDGTPDG